MSNMEGDAHSEWVAANQPEPMAAEHVDGGECAYEDCDSDADYAVQFDKGGVVTLVCQPCSNTNRLYAKENDLLDHEVTADYTVGDSQ